MVTGLSVYAANALARDDGTTRLRPGFVKQSWPSLLDTVHEMKFIGGEPMKPATNWFCGWS